MDNGTTLRVGGWTVYSDLNYIERDGETVRLEPRAMDLLLCLASNAPGVVATDELIREVWRERVVSDSSIYRVVNQLRSAFSDSVPDLIETIPKRGYRLVAEVESLPEARIVGAARPGVRRAAIAIGATLMVTGALLLSPWSPMRLLTEAAAPTIAVLPFANLSGDTGDDYLGDGIAEEVIHALSNGSGLRVIARTSSFSFKNSQRDVREIGSRLGASFLLEGSVRRDNGMIRVIAQLADSESGLHLWSEAYDRLESDLIEVERDVALTIAERVMGDSADLERVAAALPPANLSAYEYYLLARQRMSIPSGLTREWPMEDADAAIDYLRRSIRLDPGYPRGHARLAEALAMRAVVERQQIEIDRVISPDVLSEARASVERALELAPDLAEAHLAKGSVARLLEGDDATAEASFREAIALNPNLADAYLYLGRMIQGEAGLELLLTAAELDPLRPELHAWIARILFRRAARPAGACEGGRDGRATEASSALRHAARQRRRGARAVRSGHR